jgi:hypothetical protein
VIQDRLLEEGVRLADGSRPKTSADGFRGVREPRVPQLGSRIVHESEG